MLQTKIINNDTCAVSFSPTEIMVRKRGKAHFGEEKALAVLRDGKLYISATTAKEFGIEICKEELPNE